MKSSNFYSKNRILGTYSSLKQELKFSTVDMLEFLPVKYVGSKNKIRYWKRKLAEICDVAKRKIM